MPSVYFELITQTSDSPQSSDFNFIYFILTAEVSIAPTLESGVHTRTYARAYSWNMAKKVFYFRAPTFKNFLGEDASRPPSLVLLRRSYFSSRLHTFKISHYAPATAWSQLSFDNHQLLANYHWNFVCTLFLLMACVFNSKLEVTLKAIYTRKNKTRTFRINGTFRLK